MKYYAGWNLPGCLPEMEPAKFDSYEEANAWLEENRATGWSTEDEDPYVYWIDQF
jgi:hypothetical protein